MDTLAERIKKLTRIHLENKGVFLGQCVRAVGWIGGTVPELSEENGIIELPTSDVSNSGVVVGFGLAQRKPIYCIRYQGFLWYNAASIVNYAAKSKEMWNQPCPIFIRCIGMEGSIGPVASHVHHSMICRMPGIKVFAPITPNEWENVWNHFLEGDDPVFCSEHRKSFNINYEIPNVFNDAEVTFVCIGLPRIEAFNYLKHSKKFNLINIVDLTNRSILYSDESIFRTLIKSKQIYVIDSDYVDCGISSSIALEISQFTYPFIYKTANQTVQAIGLPKYVAGFAKHCDVVSPSIKELIECLT